VNERVARCLLLSKVLAADGIMTENERAFLDRAMTTMGLSDAERRRVVDLEGWDEAESALMSLGRAEKEALVSDLVDAASADGRLSPLEAQMVKRIAAALGLDS
jgi:uncharacterized tellurite resistance protein B-like protein